MFRAESFSALASPSSTAPRRRADRPSGSAEGQPGPCATDLRGSAHRHQGLSSFVANPKGTRLRGASWTVAPPTRSRRGARDSAKAGIRSEERHSKPPGTTHNHPHSSPLSKAAHSGLRRSTARFSGLPKMETDLAKTRQWIGDTAKRQNRNQDATPHGALGTSPRRRRCVVAVLP